MNDIYTPNQIIGIIDNMENVRALALSPEHDLLLQIYDVELALERIDLTEEEEQVLQFWLQDYSVNEIANSLKTYERKIYRVRKKIAQKVSERLEGGLSKYDRN